ncbi:TonB-dependent copper receptor [Acinetobacter sp. Ac_877]|uniref:TonB-dependent copper receptor n=1 Tax=Acinetobacter portensis TaxID=1839785 RepID=UPI00128DAB22|nr:TonB-dependent copper receptor [Acinetobacter portensis]MPW42781.1 TonB-dependent copper receptor [Acinetobacter portensis]
MAQPKFFLQPLAAAICVACYSPVVLANDSSESKKLAPITVTAQAGNDANGLIVRADPKQPIQPIPATDGADYLQSIVGFSSVNSGAGTNGDVTFRGMFGSRIKILTDGTENLGACPSRMDSPTSYISPESYDQISVIKGPQTVQYANTGSAATVIFERSPEKLTSEKPYRGQASVLMGSFGRLDHNLETAIGDEHKYVRLNANRSVADSYKDGSGNTVPSDWKRWNVDVALGWTPDENTWLELTGGKADGEVVYAGRGMDGSQFARESLGLRFEKKNVTDVIKKIEAQVNYSFNDHVMDNYSLRKVPQTHDMTTHEMVDNPSSMQVTRRTLNTRLAVTHEWDKLQVITGVDSQHNKHAGGMKSNTMDMPLKSDMQFQSYGAFGELTYQLEGDNRVVAGARIDQVKVDALKTQQSRSETLPSAFIRFENTHPEHEDGKTYIGLGYVERVPDYWELFKTDYYGVTANTFKKLETEKTLQLDFGYQHEHGAFNSWASAYTGMIKDYILMTYPKSQNSGHGHGHSMGMGSGKQNTVDSRNVDAVIAGAEAGIGYKFTDAIQADVSAMYAWGKNTTDNTPLPQISPLEARVNLRYVQDKYNIGLLWRVVDGQNRVSLNEGNIVGYDLKKSSGFTTLSINGSYNLTKDVDLSIGIDNLLDKTYTEHLNKMGSSGFGDDFATQQFNNTGRNYWARMSMKF